jgi:hypothetical protein
MIEVGKSQTEDHAMQIKSIAIDLGKTTFHLVALGIHSQVLVRKKLSRPQLLAYTANLPSSLIGISGWRPGWDRTFWGELCASRGTRCA